MSNKKSKFLPITYDTPQVESRQYPKLRVVLVVLKRAIRSAPDNNRRIAHIKRRYSVKLFLNLLPYPKPTY